MKQLWFQIGIEKINGEITVGYEVVTYKDPELEDKVCVTAPTAPEAICIAAVRVKASEEQLKEMGL